jgi:hypothetical protein
MFVRPDCPCSKASLAELSWLMNQCQGRLTAHVLVLRLASQHTNQAPSDLWRVAAAIAGLNVHPDINGREARLFRAETSGQVVLYGADGRLRFQGGMTLSRGRHGDNPGRDALRALIYHEPSRVTQTPVYGCQLFKSS